MFSNYRELLVLFLLVFLIPSHALAAPTARFTARPIQGAICVAPCAVHFDAIGLGALSTPTPYVSAETTDPDFPRTFHSLHFAWNFGDPGQGVWTHSGVDKNTAVGGIAGHTYVNPGTYTVGLTVTNPAGQTSSTTRTVTVVAPSSHFSAANTFCFANSASNWAGCPLNCAGGDDNCTVTSNFYQLMTAGDNCSGTGDCANATVAGRRIFLRRGDTFTMSFFFNASDNAGPGLIEAFGTGARPVIDLAGQFWHQGGGWTTTEVELRNASLGAIGTMRSNSAGGAHVSNVTFYNVDVTQFSGACILESPFSEGLSTIGHLHAFVEVNCTAVPGHNNYASWPGSRYTLWMGGTFNKNGGANSSLRAHHMQHYLMQHTNWINPAPGREHWQFRSNDSFIFPTLNHEGQMYNLISDNRLVEAANGGFFSVRLCVDSGCNCGEQTVPGPYCGDGVGVGRIVPVRDIIFERNFHRWDTQPPSSHYGVYEIQGGGVTIRNNVYDMQNGMSGLSNFVVVTGEPVAHSSGSTPTGDVHVYNNTIFFDHLTSGSMNYTNNRGANGNGCPSGCFARNNLVSAPGFNGTFSVGGNFTGSNNVVFNAGEPFIAAVPEQGLTSIGNFRLNSSATSLINTGYTFNPAVDTNRWVHTDMLGGCRPTGAGWDIGAHEFGAVSCSAANPDNLAPAPPGSLRLQ